MTPARGGATKPSRRTASATPRRRKTPPAPGPDNHPGLQDLDDADLPDLPPLDAADGIDVFMEALRAGKPWYPELLGVVARWVTPEETVDGVTYCYLLAGEAFDWRRLAERLLDAAAGLVPADEVERLLFEGRAPTGEDPSEEAFARAIGREKYRAHLNFQYGVTVEETLLLQAEQDLHKAHHLEGPRGEPTDVAAFERVYGKTFAELAAEYRVETGCSLGEHVSQADLAAFTYWCSKYRFRLAEPARVASDTRKALALLSRLEAARAPRERRLPAPEPARIIEL